jgi:hypothetical protein
VFSRDQTSSDSQKCERFSKIVPALGARDGTHALAMRRQACPASCLATIAGSASYGGCPSQFGESRPAHADDARQHT